MSKRDLYRIVDSKGTVEKTKHRKKAKYFSEQGYIVEKWEVHEDDLYEAMRKMEDIEGGIRPYTISGVRATRQEKSVDF